MRALLALEFLSHPSDDHYSDQNQPVAFGPLGSNLHKCLRYSVTTTHDSGLMSGIDLLRYFLYTRKARPVIQRNNSCPYLL